MSSGLVFSTWDVLSSMTSLSYRQVPSICQQGGYGLPAPNSHLPFGFNQSPWIEPHWSGIDHKSMPGNGWEDPSWIGSRRWVVPQKKNEVMPQNKCGWGWALKRCHVGKTKQNRCSAQHLIAYNIMVSDEISIRRYHHSNHSTDFRTKGLRVI